MLQKAKKLLNSYPHDFHMIKQLFFSLLLTSTALQSMELTVLHDPNMLFHITEQICNAHIFLVEKKDIDSLAMADTTLCEYYSREKTQQNIIRQMALQNDISDCNIACCLKYNAIGNKIRCFFDKAKQGKIFTEDDLKDTWYLNSTITIWADAKSTLLTTAYHAQQLDTIKTLIHAKTDVKNNINNSLLTTICDDRRAKRFKSTQLLTIAELLLEHGADPNFKLSNKYNTPLIAAVLASSIDKECAHLLLWYNADPCKIVVNKIYCGHYYERICSAFDLEETGWLKKMVDNKQQTIFNYLLFKHHNLEELTLLQELIDLIGYKVWEVGKNSYKTIEDQTKITL